MYDIIIPVVASDVATLKKNFYYIDKNLDGKRIIAIGSAEVKKQLDRDGCGNIVFLDEDSVFPGMRLAEIKKAILQHGADTPQRAGWYFQQFLKLAYAYECQDEYYLSWDSDTVPARPVSMFENDRPVFDMKKEYHPSYFATMERLFNGRVSRLYSKSFISEHMLFSTECVKKMLDEIESNTSLPGRAFWEKILWAIDTEDIPGSGFSEFETYGNYVCTTWPGQYSLRETKSLRTGAWYLGYEWTDGMIEWAAKDYAIISFEKNSTAPGWLSKMGKGVARSFLRHMIRLKWIKGLYGIVTRLYKTKTVSRICCRPGRGA